MKNNENILSFVTGGGFSAFFMDFTGDALKVFILGVVGGLGGLFARWIWNILKDYYKK